MERSEKFKELQRLRSQASVQNRRQVNDEIAKSRSDRKKTMLNEKKRQLLEMKLERLEAQSQGQDPDRKRVWDVTIKDYEQSKEIEETKERRRAATKIADYGDLAHVMYNENMKQFEPDMAVYNDIKDDTSVIRQAPKDKVKALAESLREKDHKTGSKRQSKSSEEVDYINERNRKFNEKLSRFYDEHTAEAKSALERGSAL
ncbi:hypothetical protein CANCADRAFT_48054 [Tortispora caseinolytica NRRL Y-17796]|uniref:Pre-mRNA-splicing factor SYF2 n=1 Tax=Tortispora caseinolytica NRRL Y-17796 TaxID=767744 RepID=A0A1E4TKK5_9ASCO|nr:hypothetical protein CANCADRAFT_48054 [Tortispora caseinolytica NRRL Y-17796]